MGSSPWEWYASANRTNWGKRNTKAKFQVIFVLESEYLQLILSALLLSSYGTVTEKHQK
jgi:hypothetical protein